MKQGTFPSLSQAPCSSFLSGGNHLTFHFWFILILKKYIMYYLGFTLIFTPVFTSMSLPSSHTYTAVQVIWNYLKLLSTCVCVCVCVCLSLYMGAYTKRGIHTHTHTHTHICLSCLISCL